MRRQIRLLTVALSTAILLTACNSADEPRTTTDSPNLTTSEEATTEDTTGVTAEETTMEDVKTPYKDVTNQPTSWTETSAGDNYNLAGIAAVRNVGLFTGDASANKTRERYKVGGTDLGIPVVHNDKLYIFFGDTFGGDDAGNPMGGGLWRSNVLAYTEDRDFADGLQLDGFITGSGMFENQAIELIGSKKIPGIEHTVIPTGAISVNGNIYSYFMSVKEWGDPGRWMINYGGLAKSEDDGQTFRTLKEIELDPDRFGQVSPILIDDMIYFIGIGGGRFGDAYLMRVAPEQIESLDAYEYFAGTDENGEPQFSADVNDSVAVADGPVGEPAIMYNEYLEEYIISYLDEQRAAIVMRVAKQPWGPYSEKLDMIRSADYPALYGGFVHDALIANEGQTIYFTMSMWDPIYNSILFEVELDRKP